MDMNVDTEAVIRAQLQKELAAVQRETACLKSEIKLKSYGSHEDTSQREKKLDRLKREEKVLLRALSPDLPEFTETVRPAEQNEDTEIRVTITIRKSDLNSCLNPPEPEPEFKDGFMHHRLVWPDWADETTKNPIAWNLVQCLMFICSLADYVIDCIPLLILFWFIWGALERGGLL